MATHHTEISRILAQQAHGRNKSDLAAAAGLSRPTLRGMLSGQDFRVSSLLSLAEVLGLSVVLVPQGVAHALSAHPADSEPTNPGRDLNPVTRYSRPRTQVEAALARVQRVKVETTISTQLRKP